MTELTPRQIVTLQNLLDDRAQSIESTMFEQVSRLREITDPQLTTAVGDIADQAELAKEREQENAAVDREISELRAIDMARMRIEKGEAGICVDCGEPIDFRRLLARPTAARCINCQALSEHPARQVPREAVWDKASGEEQRATNT